MESWNDARKLFDEFIRFETTAQQRAVWALDSQHAFLIADIPNLPAIWHALDIDHVGHIQTHSDVILDTSRTLISASGTLA